MSSAKPNTHADIESAMLDLLKKRGVDKSICPSEVARQLAGADAWRELMDLVRDVARQLAHRGVLVITQRGVVVAPDSFSGPIRLRLAASE